MTLLDHLARLEAPGSGVFGKPIVITPGAAARFWKKVRVDDPADCWEWIGYTDRGYGRFDVGGGKPVRAHRFSYVSIRGEIPYGLVLDHLCRNKCCVNPFHLEAVTNKENVLRGAGPIQDNARKTHCKWGHVLSGRNVKIRVVGKAKMRACRQCRYASENARRRARALEKLGETGEGP